MGASASNSKTIYSDGSSTYGYTLSVSWSESGASASTNKSTISASASLSGSLVGFNSNYDQYLSVYWYDNNSYSGGTRIAIISFTSAGMNQGGTRTASGTISVPHKDDGSLKGYCKAYFTNNNGGYWCPPTSDISTDTKTCDTIARASAPTATPNPLTIGSSGATLTINTNRKSSSFMHTVKVECGSWSWTSSAREVGASVNVTVPYSVIAQFSATSKTATATVTCTTFNGTTQIASAKTCSVTFQVNASDDHANVGTVTVQDTNARTSAVTQDNTIYIANISTLEATIPLTVSGSYTELASAVVTCGTKSQTYSLSGTSASLTFEFDKVNASSLTVKVTDKRGNSVTGTKSWTLIAYQPVTAVATVGRPSATGSVGVGQVTGMAYGGSFGATQNSLTIEVDFKKHDDADYDPQGTESDTLALTQDGYNSWSDALTFAYTLDYQYQYDIKFTVSDLFSTATYVAQLMQGLPILSWDETEVDVFGNLHVHDRSDPYVWQDVMDGFDAITEYGGVKNLLPVTAVTTTVNGITFTVNSDGTIKANGTATGTTPFVFSSRNISLNGDYVLTGCPSGGATNTYRMDVRTEGGGQEWYDTGDGVTCSLNGQYYFVIRIEDGVTVNNLIFKPMLRDARYANETYQQHAMTNLELTYYHYTREIKLTVNSSYVSSSNLYALQIGDNMIVVTGWIAVNSSVTGSRVLAYLPTDLVAVINTLIVTWDTSNNTPEMFYIGNNSRDITSRRALTNGHTYQFSQIIFTRKS